MANELFDTSAILNEIRTLVLDSRHRIATQVNSELLSTYWNIGKIIVSHEQNGETRADYGNQTLKKLSKELTKELGQGFSLSNIYNMRAFYFCYPKFQTVSGN